MNTLLRATPRLLKAATFTGKLFLLVLGFFAFTSSLFANKAAATGFPAVVWKVSSFTVGAQGGTALTYGAGGNATFAIKTSEGFEGSGTQKADGLTISAWAAGSAPAGLTISFGSGASYTPSGSSQNFTLTITTSASTPAGSFGFTVLNTDPNGGNTQTTGTLTVGKAALSVTTNAASMTYGGTVPTFTATYSGFVNGDAAANLTTAPTFTFTTGSATSPVGSYNITPSGAVDPNYTFTYHAGTLTIGQAALSITANAASMTYGGGSLPAFSATFSGFVNGDNSTKLTTQPTFTSTGTATSPAGGYTITPSGAVDANYAITYHAGTLTIGQAALSITANAASMTYGGGSLPAFSAAFSGFVNGDNSTKLTTQPALSTTATAASPAGGYTITPSGAVDNNYAITYHTGTLTIGQAALTVTADNQTSTYGQALPALTVSYAGFVNGDTQASLTTAATASTTATAASPAGGYTITPSGAVDNNYAIGYTNGSLNIGQAALTVTADNQTSTYGQALPALTVSYAGFVNGDTQASLTTAATASTTATAASPAGGYTITPSGAVDNNYAIGYTNGSLNIGQAALTVTADNQTSTYGQALPALTVSYAGFVNGDTQASLTTAATASTTATAASPAGGYTITPSGAVDNNYAIGYTNGSLNIGQAALTVTADNQTSTYGQALPALTVSYAGFVNGDTQASLTTAATASTTATAASPAGGYTITPSGAVDNNYAIGYTNGSLNIGQAALTVTADNQTSTYGQALPALTVSYAGFVNGDTQASLTTAATASTTATAASPAGGYTITPSGAVDNNYAIGYTNGSLNIGQAALTATADNQTSTYGQALPALTVSYAGFVNGDTQASLTTAATASTTATAASPAGGYTITPSGAVDNNYAIGYTNGSLNIGQAALTVTADNQTSTYGQALPALTVSYAGFVNGDTQASLTTAATASTTATAASPAGGYTITPSGAVDNNYAIGYTNGSLNIGQAPLNITANDASKIFGTTITFAGTEFSTPVLPNGDAVTSVTLSSAGTAANAAVGPYAIVAALPITGNGSFVASNYNITFTNGTLSVTSSTDATLSSLTNSGSSSIAPSFDPGTFSYGLSVLNNVTTVTVTPTSANANATIKVNGTAVTSGNASGPIGLSVGDNNINIVVTAQDGSTKQIYTLTVTRAKSTNANLSALKPSKGTISPGFGAATSYTTSVANGVASITITPTAADATATITVNGASVASGAASGAIALSVGANTITTVVTAQDGVTKKTYTLVVTEQPSAVATLSGLTPGTGKLSPAFNVGVFSYTESVANTVSTITVTPTTTVNTATVTVNGTTVASGTASAPIALNIGANTITVAVTAQDGSTTKTYTITATRVPSTNANLSAFKPSNGTLSPGFGAATSYTTSVANGLASMTITPTAADANATITVNGVPVTSGTTSGAIALKVGANTITTVVTAQDGVTKKTYTLVVTEQASAVATLSGLTPGTGKLSPGFNVSTVSYTESVANTVSTITVTPTTTVTTATVTVNGTTVASGTASAPIALNIGANTITVAVTAQDGSTTKTYTITATRVPSTNANLSVFKPSNGTLSPGFGAATSYTTSVANGLASMTITPTAADANATITVNGVPVTSGTASGAIALSVGANTITTVVTAQDGVTKKTYTLVVTEQPSAVATLSGLTPGTGKLSPGFNVGIFSYTENVANAVSTITVTPTSTVNTATVTVNGTAVASGTASDAIALAVGANTITTVVTAQDGSTTKTYTLTVTRATGAADNFDDGISVTKPTETPSLNDDIVLVHQGVSPNGDGINDFLVIDGIQAYPNNKLMIMNRNGQLIYEAQGYDNSSKMFDGHSNKNGQMQLPGTYFYQLDYTVKGITKHKTGYIILKY